MKIKIVALMVILAVFCSKSQDITPGITFTDGQRLTAAQLGQLVSQAQIQTYFYTTKVSQGSPAAGDLFLVYSAASGTFHKLNAQSLIYGNSNIISSQVNYTTTGPYSSFLFYDPTNAWLGQITESNLAALVSSGINFSNVVLYTTNGNALPTYPTPFDPGATNQLNFIVYDTNGIPSSVSISNLMMTVTPYEYTNNLVPWVFKQTYAPWLVYGTNQVTNVWAQTILFPVTNLYMFGNTNVPTIQTNDAIPFYSQQQHSNTTMTVSSLSAYLQSTYALPNYTQARISFGIQFTNKLGRLTDNTHNTFGTDYTGFSTNPVCISIYLTRSATMPGASPTLATNTPYWAVAYTNSTSVTNALTPKAFTLYSSYTDALSQTNPIVPSGGDNTYTNGISIVPAFTSYNADVIDLAQGTISAGMSPQAGQYAVYFRTPAVSTNYYVSGVAQFTGTTPAILMVDSSTNTTLNYVWVDTANPNTSLTYINAPRTFVLISSE